MHRLNELERLLFDEIAQIPILDTHSHINPLSPAAQSLDDLLGYHYFTELAHSSGLAKKTLEAQTNPRERTRLILGFANHFRNTVQFEWLEDIARNFIGFMGEQITFDDGDKLWTLAERRMSQPDWATQVLRNSRIERIFLTNDFDDPLTGFDSSIYIPCLRVDDLVFHLHQPGTRERLARFTNNGWGDTRSLSRSLSLLFQHFISHNARACAISLPPDFAPEPVSAQTLDALLHKPALDAKDLTCLQNGVFWLIAEKCNEHQLPMQLMIGVNRKVYPQGVYQGQDLFDQRTSLIQYAALFNHFPDVRFFISVLTSMQNQELASYSWIFPNVLTHGHWWYSNIPALIYRDSQLRLQAVPISKQIGYYSDAYKLEFILPKYNMYRQTLVRILAEDFIQQRGWTETQAIELARQLLHDNANALFGFA